MGRGEEDSEDQSIEMGRGIFLFSLMTPYWGKNEDMRKIPIVTNKRFSGLTKAKSPCENKPNRGLAFLRSLAVGGCRHKPGLGVPARQLPRAALRRRRS